jgi:carboxyl-terminal processing protease
MSLNYEGIGASLQLIDDYVTVMNVIEGGPAAAAGTLGVNDRITAVGQGKDGALTDVIGWRIDDVVQLIRGKGGTAVRLQVLPGGAAPGTPEKTLDYLRGKVTLEAQAARKEIKTIKRGTQELKVGVINVPGFYSDYEAQRAGNADYRSTTRDVRRLIDELRKENVDGLVLDLRGNGGGFLPEAQSLTGLFIDRGPVVQVKIPVSPIRVRSRSWSIASARRLPRFLPARSRTTVEASCSGSAPSARARSRTSYRYPDTHRARSMASSPLRSASSIV